VHAWNPEIPALKRLSQEDLEFKVGLGCTVIDHLKLKKKKKSNT
jgi:hypothetical protein